MPSVTGAGDDAARGAHLDRAGLGHRSGPPVAAELVAAGDRPLHEGAVGVEPGRRRDPVPVPVAVELPDLPVVGELDLDDLGRAGDAAPGARTGTSASTRRSRLRGMRSAEPMRYSAVSGSAPNP